MERGRFCRFRRSEFFSVLLLAAVVLAGPARAVAQDQMAPLKIKVGEKAPDFSLPSSDGKTVKLSGFAGHNVLIDFYRGYW
jgi:cytochrome oxidase Cu insertion factor (SCO1/SenC/PrrC family)